MLNKIGFFQLGNLIQNRVPFFLLNMGPDISNWYTSLYKDHVNKNQTIVSSEGVENLLETRNVAKDAAIILLCADGQNSLVIFQALEKKGYTNVYLVDGGYQQMMTERSTT